MKDESRSNEEDEVSSESRNGAEIEIFGTLKEKPKDKSTSSSIDKNKPISFQAQLFNHQC